MTGSELLPPLAAARTRSLEFFARTRVEGFLKSLNQSTLKGHSSDFRQHRQYAWGDDPRRLDWRVLARSDRLVTREYDEVTNLDLVLALDCSGSMGYGSGELTKLDFARHCAAMLAYLLNRQRDRFGLALLRDRIAHFQRPSSGRRYLAQVFRHLADAEPAGETDIAACIPRLGGHVRRRSVFAFFSDCYEDPAALMRAVGTLRLQGHDVLLYQVHDPDEATLPFAGFTLFRDLETGAVDAADPLEIQRAYQQVFREHAAALRAGANRFAVELHALPVQNDWDAVLAGLLHERAARR